MSTLHGEGIIGGVLGVLGGSGFWAFLRRVSRPERRRIQVDAEAKVGRYHLEVIDALESENRQLRERLTAAEIKIGALEKAVMKITQGELPPEYS